MYMHPTDQALDELSMLKKALMAKWGKSPEIYVSEELQDKMERQRLKLESAIKSGVTEDILQHAEAMARGWQAVPPYKSYLDEDTVKAIQAVFPGAQVVKIKGEPDFDYDRGDEIPF